MRIGQWVKKIAMPDDPIASNDAHAPTSTMVVDPRTHPNDTSDAAMTRGPVDDANEPRQRWRAFIDRVTINAIEGWAVDMLNPGTHVTVEAVTSEGKTAVAVAYLYREDVKRAGYGDGNCGFFIDLSKLSIEDESAIVRFAGSRHPITTEAIEFDPGRAVLTTEMPSSFKVAMELLAAETSRVAEAAGITQ